MTEYDNTNRGVLFKNDRRESDKHPEYNGSINVDGVDYWLSAWVKDGKKGKFFSLAIKPKQAPQAKSSAPARIPGSKHTPIDMDDEIPFAPEWR